MSTGTAGKRERERGSPPSTINTIVRSMGVLLLNKSYYTVHPGPRFFWSDKPTHSFVLWEEKGCDLAWHAFPSSGIPW